MSFLIDSDWMIDGLSGRSDTVAFLEAHRDEGLMVSLVTVGELYEGAYGSPQTEAHLTVLHRFLAPFTVVPLTTTTMHHFGRVRALLRKRGNLIPDFDLLIAATALEHEIEAYMSRSPERRASVLSQQSNRASPRRGSPRHVYCEASNGVYVRKTLRATGQSLSMAS